MVWMHRSRKYFLPCNLSIESDVLTCCRSKGWMTMKRKLLQILCCPVCMGELAVTTITLENGDEIVDGTLRCCCCDCTYAIRGAIPRMIPDMAGVNGTKRKFQLQWSDRFAGKAEPRGIIFAQDVDETVRWMFQCAQRALHLGGVGRWCLDAGCGSGEKTRGFAAHVGTHEVVGMDLSDTLEQSAAEGRTLPNVHFVQGDILRPPFRDHAFAFAVSYAALHHTPDTARAFKAIAGKVAKWGTFVTWIYPLAEDYPDGAYGLLYRQRDRHFLSLAGRLPPWASMLWCRVYVALLFPFVLPRMKHVSVFGAQCERHGLTLKQQYDAAVFYTYDNVAPFHQHRHGQAEVLAWYAECNFDEVDSGYPGLYVGDRTFRTGHQRHAAATGETTDA
ncbi:hypothetical protein WL02_31100 [Burkholderia ubonensis]|uniref:Methyltransferase type 11 domain-containing protein n=2 Tax=Burkholderia ubonensis TaxID=101571 RepID=A0AAW3MUM7_9BURK|nr:hypothetical protein WJ75_04505 [Burkholderia ubonensis]KVP94103.1 hypothetical protein WJ96_13175 [Burkholderia ubonensis]KVQ49503.1 hypothetical protein WK04_06860 [Burkholderia ubonensis]KVX25323.1 hypothetical protein WL02_31100 [Burkholderia ubonensis]KVZ89034.1 hypothetical protein WL25_23730 [Burkholderia ubonensis]